MVSSSKSVGPRHTTHHAATPGSLTGALRVLLPLADSSNLQVGAGFLRRGTSRPLDGGSPLESHLRQPKGVLGARRAARECLKGLIGMMGLPNEPPVTSLRGAKSQRPRDEGAAGEGGDPAATDERRPAELGLKTLCCFIKVYLPCPPTSSDQMASHERGLRV